MALTGTELVALATGELGVTTIAARHGLSEAEVQRTRDAFVAGLRAGAEGRASARRRPSRLLLAAAVTLTASAAFAQLVTFQANTPALASDVNGNFALLKSWLEAKVGPVTSNNVTSGTVTATTVSATTVTGTTVSGTTVSATTLTATGNTTLGSTGQTLRVNGTVNLFGSSASVPENVEQTAGTDGLVVVLLVGTGGCSGSASAFGQAAPAGQALVTRAQTSAHAGCGGQDYATAEASFTMPVRKGERYKVYGNGLRTFSATFSPLGL